MILGTLGVFSQLLQDDLRRTVSQASTCNVTVLYGDDGLGRTALRYLMDNDLTVAAELGGNSLCNAAQSFKLAVSEDISAPLIF